MRPVAQDAAADVADASPHDASEEPRPPFEEPDGAVDVPAMSERGMQMIEEIAARIHENRGDCAKVADAIDQYYKDNEALVQRMKSIYEGMERDKRAVLQKRYRPRFDVAWKRLQPVLKKCKDNDRVKHALDELDGH